MPAGTSVSEGASTTSTLPFRRRRSLSSTIILRNSSV